MNVLPASISDRANLPTRYEVAVYVDGDRARIIGYVGRRTKQVLLELCGANASFLKSLLTEEELDMNWNYTKNDGVSFADRVKIRFTGRTERDAAQSLNML